MMGIGYAFNATAEIAAIKALANRIRSAALLGQPADRPLLRRGRPEIPLSLIQVPAITLVCCPCCHSCWWTGTALLLQAHVGCTAAGRLRGASALSRNLSCPSFCNTSSLFNG